MNKTEQRQKSVQRPTETVSPLSLTLLMLRTKQMQLFLLLLLILVLFILAVFAATLRRCRTMLARGIEIDRAHGSCRRFRRAANPWASWQTRRYRLGTSRGRCRFWRLWLLEEMGWCFGLGLIDGQAEVAAALAEVADLTEEELRLHHVRGNEEDVA